MIVTADLVERISNICRDCEEAILQAYRSRPGNPNQIEFASFGKIRAMRFPYVPFFNRAYGLGEDQLEQLPKVLNFYRETNTTFRLWLSPGGTAEMLSRALVSHGFIPWEYHVKFYADLRELPPKPVDSKVKVERVDAASLDEYMEVMLLGRDMPLEHHEGAKANMRHRLAIPGMHLFLGRLNGKAIGGANFFYQGDVAYLADAATPAIYRGHGCQLKLMEARIALARELGCKLLVGCTGFDNPSFRNMQRSGLQIAYTDMAWFYVSHGA